MSEQGADLDQFSNRIHTDKKAEPAESGAYDLISKFTTRVWEHPLVDKKTRLYRNNFFSAADEFIDRNKIDRHKVLILPIGSFRWIAGPSSDYDVDIVYKSLNDEEIVESGGAGRLHTVGNSVTAELLSKNPHLMPLSVLFTPDNYIVGDKELAAQLRLQYVKTMTSKPDLKVEAERKIRLYFENFVRSWPNQNTGGPIGREERFRHNLQLRARQARMPDNTYQESFLNALKNIQPPSIGDYHQGFLYSGGTLAIDPRYSATGIQEEQRLSFINRLRKNLSR